MMEGFKHHQSFFKAIEIAIFFTFSIFFIFMMRDIWTKFSSKAMTTVVNFSDNGGSSTKLLPALTFCPWPAYKRRGFFFKESGLEMPKLVTDH